LAVNESWDTQIPAHTVGCENIFFTLCNHATVTMIS